MFNKTSTWVISGILFILSLFSAFNLFKTAFPILNIDLEMSSGYQRYDFNHIDDVVTGLIDALDFRKKNKKTRFQDKNIRIQRKRISTCKKLVC